MCLVKFLILLCCVVFVGGDELCRSIRTQTSGAFTYEYTSYIICEHGCCGSDYSRECCDASVSVGLIIGIIVAVIVVVGGIVILIILCVYCFNTKTTRSRGNIIAPTPLQEQNVIYTTNPAWFPSAQAHPYPYQGYAQRNNVHRTEPTQASAPPPPLDPVFPPARSTLTP